LKTYGKQDRSSRVTAQRVSIATMNERGYPSMDHTGNKKRLKMNLGREDRIGEFQTMGGDSIKKKGGSKQPTWYRISYGSKYGADRESLGGASCEILSSEQAKARGHRRFREEVPHRDERKKGTRGEKVRRDVHKKLRRVKSRRKGSNDPTSISCIAKHRASQAERKKR